jgi:hypothetical protein
VNNLNDAERRLGCFEKHFTDMVILMYPVLTWDILEENGTVTKRMEFILFRGILSQVGPLIMVYLTVLLLHGTPLSSYTIKVIEDLCDD